jgi:hypothetical protein
MTVNLEQKVMKPSAKITEEKRKYILNNVKFTRNEELWKFTRNKELNRNKLLFYSNIMKPLAIVSLTPVKARTRLMTSSSRKRIIST